MQEVFRKIEAEPKLDMMLVFLKTSHNTDLNKFLDEENRFKDYAETKSSFIKSNHTWYAMRIVKPNNDVRLSYSDVYNIR